MSERKEYIEGRLARVSDTLLSSGVRKLLASDGFHSPYPFATSAHIDTGPDPRTSTRTVTISQGEIFNFYHLTRGYFSWKFPLDGDSPEVTFKITSDGSYNSQNHTSLQNKDEAEFRLNVETSFRGRQPWNFLVKESVKKYGWSDKLYLAQRCLEFGDLTRNEEFLRRFLRNTRVLLEVARSRIPKVKIKPNELRDLDSLHSVFMGIDDLVAFLNSGRGE